MWKKLIEFLKKLKNKFDSNTEKGRRNNNILFLFIFGLFIGINFSLINSVTKSQPTPVTQTQNVAKKSVPKAEITQNIGRISAEAIKDNIDKIQVFKGAVVSYLEMSLKTKEVLLFKVDNTAMFSLEKEVIFPNQINYYLLNAYSELPHKTYFDIQNQVDEKMQAKDESEHSSFIGGVIEFLLKNIISILFLIVLIFSLRMTNAMSSFKNKFNMLKPDQIDGTIDDLVGMEDIKKEILHIEDMYKNRELYQSHGIKKSFNIMLSGPAGTGKTKIASLLAKRLELPILFGSGANLETGFVGGGASTLKSLEKEAKKHDRCIVFLDEAQTLFMKRGAGQAKWEDDTANTLLAMLDGVNSTDGSEIVWIVASNFDENTMMMDEAMLRRFQLKINFRLPNKQERLALIERFLSKKEARFLAENLNLTFMAEVTANLAPAIIETIINKASMIAIRDNKGIITDDILFKAYEQTTMGLTDRETTKDMNKQREIIAKHELGHFFMHLDVLKDIYPNVDELKENIPVLKISTEANSRFNALGYVLNKQDDVKLKTRTEYEHEIKILYGGVASEELFYGEENITAGSHNDIQKVSKLLKVMVNELSMYKKSKLNYGVLEADDCLNKDIIREIEDKSNELYHQTLADLKKYISLIEYITPILLERYVLSKEEIFELIEQKENTLLTSVEE